MGFIKPLTMLLLSMRKAKFNRNWGLRDELKGLKSSKSRESLYISGKPNKARN